ncbi:hypothetical protein KIPB_006067 [Kipferlia bialata]|uniref:Uncharacterized protein n=1 Tax=Kipferlia bialata TaxID=797122 RepID=A0A9K3GIT4_9EUKA|nr:hypothetical protein KIPB_004089 [Kipferlia bialata]GIQ84553.1 hypothetical protein KIPB_006067 [Kipferlia bialata]|eukprot:g4089.t1
MYQTLRLDPSGLYSFTLNDMAPEVLCRLLVIAHTCATSLHIQGQKKDKAWDKETEAYLWRVHYESYVSEADIARLRATCRALHSELEALVFGLVADTVSDQDHSPLPLPSLPQYRVGPATRDALLPLLSLWAELEPINYLERCHRSRLDVHLRRFAGKHQEAADQVSTFSQKQSSEAVSVLEKRCRKLAGAFYDKSGGAERLHKCYQKHLDCLVYGSFSGRATAASVCNPTLYRDCDVRPCLSNPSHCPRWTVHYATQPLPGFPGEERTDDTPSLPDCKRIFRDWMRCLHSSMASGRADVTLVIGDCLDVLLERSLGPNPHSYSTTVASDPPEPFLFDHIECSNIADYVGTLTILTVAPGFLRTPGVSCLVLVLMLTRHHYMSEQAFLQAATGVRVRDLPHVFGVRCVGGEEEIDRGSTLMSTSLLPYKCNIPSGRTGWTQNALGGATNHQYTHLVFTRTPTPSPPPSIELHPGGMSGHVHKCLMGLFHKCLPYTPERIVGACIPTMAMFAAVVAVGCRRGLFAAHMREGRVSGQHLMAIPERLSTSYVHVLGGVRVERVGTGRVEGWQGDGACVSLFPVSLACPFPNWIKAISSGASDKYGSMLTKLDASLLPSLLATLTEYGIDTRSAGPPYTLTVGSLEIRPTLALSRKQSVCNITMVPRHIVCDEVDLYDDALYPTREAFARGEGMSQACSHLLGKATGKLGPMSGMFKTTSPTLQGRLVTDGSGKDVLLGASRSVHEGYAHPTVTLYGVGQNVMDPLTEGTLSLRLTMWSPLIGDGRMSTIPGAIDPILGPLMPVSSDAQLELGRVMCASPRIFPSATPPVSGVHGLQWVRGANGALTLACQCDIPASIPNSIVVDKSNTPCLVPLSDPLHTVSSTMDAYVKSSVATVDPTTTLSDTYQVALRLGGQEVATLTSPIPLHPSDGVRLQISRTKRFIRVSVRAAPYTVPAHLAGAVVNLSQMGQPVRAGSEDLEKTDLLYLWGDCGMRQIEVMKGPGSANPMPEEGRVQGRLAECLGMPQAARAAGMGALGQIGWFMNQAIGTYVGMGVRLVPIRGPSGIIAAMLFHDFYVCDKSCVVDMSFVVFKGMPQKDASPLSKALSQCAPGSKEFPNFVVSSPHSLTVLTQCLNHMSRYTLNAPVHSVVKRNVPQHLLKYVVRVGMRPLHPVMMLHGQQDKAAAKVGPLLAQLGAMGDRPGWLKTEAVGYM